MDISETLLGDRLGLGWNSMVSAILFAAGLYMSKRGGE